MNRDYFFERIPAAFKPFAPIVSSTYVHAQLNTHTQCPKIN